MTEPGAETNCIMIKRMEDDRYMEGERCNEKWDETDLMNAAFRIGFVFLAYHNKWIYFARCFKYAVYTNAGEVTEKTASAPYIIKIIRFSP